MAPPLTKEKRPFRPRLPNFLKQSIPPAGGPAGDGLNNVRDAIADFKMNTVCVEAKCPNRTHCFNRGTLAFQILGNICTRSCGFCAEKFGNPSGSVDETESIRLVEAAKRLQIKHAVITSPSRDDLFDGGASQFAALVRQFRKELPRVTVEVLTPDFMARKESLQTVFESRPDIFNHNIETVRRLTPKVRSKATYDRSLFVLREAAKAGLTTKSGLMVGHGEGMEELTEAFNDLAEAGCRALTIGQYLPPSTHHLPLLKLYNPDEFDSLRRKALEYGFLDVSAGPLVRSSYHADEAATLK